MLLYQPARQGFLNRLLQQRKHIGCKFLQRTGIQHSALHLLRCIIIRLKSHGRKHQFRRSIDIGMGNIYPTVKHGRFSKHNVFGMYFIASYQVFNSLKPHQVNHSGSVRKVCNQTPLPPLTQCFETQYFTFQLDIGHISIYLMDIIQATSIHIFIGEIIEQVM